MLNDLEIGGKIKECPEITPLTVYERENVRLKETQGGGRDFILPVGVGDRVRCVTAQGKSAMKGLGRRDLHYAFSFM